MLDFSQMILRLLVSLALGALMGLERELVGKEAGIRTGMMVSSGSALFAMIGLLLPAIVSPNEGSIAQVAVGNGGYLAVIANIVVGIGFLGAGIILKTPEHIRGLTTAAVIWATAAIGVLAGLGIIKFAVATAVILFLVLLLTSRVNVHRETN